jgi:hypothetical protein
MEQRLKQQCKQPPGKDFLVFVSSKEVSGQQADVQPFVLVKNAIVATCAQI